MAADQGDEERPARAIGAVQVYGTLFIDMLGWGAELLTLDRIAMKGHQDRPREDLVGRVLPTIQRYELVQGVMDRALRRAFEGPTVLSEITKRPEGEGAELLALTQRADAIYSSFSDCFVLSVPLAKHPRFGPIPLLSHLYGLMVCASIAFVTLLGERIPVRGAIEIGIGAEIQRKPEDPRTFVGASLAKSYFIERDAGHPRIKLGSHLLEYIDLVANEEAPRLDQVRPGAVQMVRSLIMREADGTHSVDYLGIHEDPVSDPSLKKARVFIDEQIAGARARKDEKLLRRYEIIDTYFKAHSL